jgi:hypothetical protein
MKKGGNMTRILSKVSAISALVLAGLVFVGCSKKENYAADTSAAGTSTTGVMTASSTAPVMQDTAMTTTSTTKKKSTTKTAPKKPTY